MAVTLSAKVVEAKTITVNWDGDVVDVSYFPNAVTPALLDEVEALAAQDDNNAIGQIMAPILDWWDVLDDQGQRIGTDADTIATLPLRWTLLVQAAIVEAQTPPESRGSVAG